MENKKEKAIQVLRTLIESGASMEDLLEQLELLGNTPKMENLEVRVSRLLKKFGVPMHIKGYEYLKTAVEMAYNDKQYILSITKKLYPDVAKKYGTTNSRVERAIRHAVERACDNVMDERFYGDLFGCTVSSYKGKPSNSECIAAMVEYLKMEEKAGR